MMIEDVRGSVHPFFGTVDVFDTVSIPDTSSKNTKKLICLTVDDKTYGSRSNSICFKKHKEHVLKSKDQFES